MSDERAGFLERLALGLAAVLQSFSSCVIVRMDQPDSASVPFITQTPAARAWCFGFAGVTSFPASGLTWEVPAFSN